MRMDEEFTRQQEEMAKLYSDFTADVARILLPALHPVIEAFAALVQELERRASQSSLASQKMWHTYTRGAPASGHRHCRNSHLSG